MKRALLTLCVLLSLTAAARAQDSGAPPAVQVQASLKPAESVVIGQHVKLLVDVLFAGDMPYPPRVKMPDMPGAQIIRFESQATTLQQSIGGTSFVGQRFEFGLFPRRGGDLAVPPAAVTLLDRAGAETGTVAGPALSLSVTVPPGVDPGAPLIASDRVTLAQEWSRSGAELKPGDALVRTIQRTAVDIPGAALPDLLVTAPPGIRVYAASPDIQDRQNRGDLTGQRTDKFTYVVERPGDFVIPPLTQSWWNLKESRLETARVDGTSFHVAAPPAGKTPSAQSRHVGWMLATLAALLLATFLAWLGWRHWNRPEQRAIRALTYACRGGDPKAVYGALANWRSLSGAAPLGPPEEKLRAALFRPGSANWNSTDGHALLAEATAHQPRHSRPSQNPLPALNPRTRPVQARLVGDQPRTGSTAGPLW